MPLGSVCPGGRMGNEAQFLPRRWWDDACDNGRSGLHIQATPVTCACEEVMGECWEFKSFNRSKCTAATSLHSHKPNFTTSKNLFSAAEPSCDYTTHYNQSNIPHNTFWWTLLQWAPTGSSLYLLPAVSDISHNVAPPLQWDTEQYKNMTTFSLATYSSPFSLTTYRRQNII